MTYFYSTELPRRLSWLFRLGENFYISVFFGLRRDLSKPGKVLMGRLKSFLIATIFFFLKIGLIENFFCLGRIFLGFSLTYFYPAEWPSLARFVRSGDTFYISVFFG